MISKCVCIVYLITCDCHGAAVQIWAHYDLKQCNNGYLKKFSFWVTVAILDLGLDTHTNFKRNQTQDYHSQFWFEGFGEDFFM